MVRALSKARLLVYSWNGTGTIGPRFRRAPPPVLNSLAPLRINLEESFIMALLILFSCLACLISKATRASVISAFSRMRLVRLCLKAWETSLILSGVEIDYFLITFRGILRSVSILSISILFFIFLILVSYVPKKSTSISSLLFSESELLVSTLIALDYFLLGPDVRIDSDCFTLISGL